MPSSEQAGQVLDQHVDKTGILGADARAEVTEYIRTKQLQPDTMLALRELVERSEARSRHSTRSSKPSRPSQQTNVRNDMYVASEAIRLMQKSHNPRLHRRPKTRP